MSCNNSIWPQLVAKLPWGHTALIFSKIKEDRQRTYYLEKTKKRSMEL